MAYKQYLVEERWPSVPGHGEEFRTWTCEVKSETETHMLVRRFDKWRFFRKWQWRPRNGMFVKIKQRISK